MSKIRIILLKLGWTSNLTFPVKHSFVSSIQYDQLQIDHRSWWLKWWNPWKISEDSAGNTKKGEWIISHHRTSSLFSKNFKYSFRCLNYLSVYQLVPDKKCEEKGLGKTEFCSWMKPFPPHNPSLRECVNHLQSLMNYAETSRNGVGGVFLIPWIVPFPPLPLFLFSLTDFLSAGKLLRHPNRATWFLASPGS